MGCSSSFPRRDRAAAGRCREREHLIKLCVQHQHAYAAAHAAYVRSLKDTGAAIRQFGDGGDTKPDCDHFRLSLDAAPPSAASDVPEDHRDSFRSSPAPHLLHARRNLPYFPPPFPDILMSSASHSRTSTLPPFRSPQKLSLVKSFFPYLPRKLPFTEDNASEADSDSHHHHDVKPLPPLPAEASVTPPAPPPAPLASQWDLYNVFPLADSRRTSTADTLDLKCDEDCDVIDNADSEKYGTPLSTTKENKQELVLVTSGTREHVYTLASALRQLDDYFLVAFESGRDVARLLEGHRTHYHSNYAGFAGSLNHSTRVLRVMSWDRYSPAKGEYAVMNCDEVDAACNNNNDKETHASTLDKLLAWEKKLHDEVKVGEVIRVQLEKKSLQLKRRLKKRDEGAAILSKTRSSVNSLQTKYSVEIQAVDAASSEVEKLRDDFLHYQLVDLVQRSMTMWETMLSCHQQQLHLIKELKLESFTDPASTTEFQRKNTLQLESEINAWRTNLAKLLCTQKNYLSSVYQWLRLHIIEIESGGSRTPGSPKKLSSPPVYALSRAWLAALDQIRGDVPLQAMKAFCDMIQELKSQQAEERRQKRRLEQLRKKLERKENVLKVQSMRPEENYGGDKEDRRGSGGGRATVEAAVQLLREKANLETEEYEKRCLRSANMSREVLVKGLPPLLDAMRGFSDSCMQHYRELFRTVTGGPVLQITY